MKKLVSLLLLSVVTLVLAGCPKAEQNARDAAAALNGSLTAAQTEYLTSCKADPSQKPCTLINQAISGQGALVTATEAYCGWSTIAPPADPNAVCKPVKTAAGALTAAIDNANLITLQLKALIQAPKSGGKGVSR